jgi:hypothetical protein
LAGEGIPRIRTSREPGTSFVDHSVAAAEIYVQLVEAERAGALELIDHEPEPDCWRHFLGPIGEAVSLRPDAFVSVGKDDYEFRSFVEVDRGTVGSSALLRKLTTYADYWRSGIEQRQHVVFPRVVWSVEHDRRAELLHGLIARLPDDARRLFVVTTPARQIDTLAGADADPGGVS